MRVLHVTPSHFGDSSVVGGAERYAWELARAMARETDVTFFALSDASSDRQEGRLRVIHAAARPLLRHPLARSPVSRRLWRAIRTADVVHGYQVHTFLTSAVILMARLCGRPVFVTDLGGGHPYSPSQYVPLLRWATAFLLLSEYSRRMWAEKPARSRPGRLEVVYGGVDTDRFKPSDAACPEPRRGAAGGIDRREVLFVGRLLPHKGIEHLIDAIEPPLALRVVGRPYDPSYHAMLLERARGKAVTFEADVDDAGLAARYRSALALVLPSVSTDWLGRTTDVAELFGLVAVEAMASGRPVIVSRTGSLPEVLEDEVTGFVVPPGDAGAIRARLADLYAHQDRADAMGRSARLRVLERFTWDAAARRCLDAYGRA